MDTFSIKTYACPACGYKQDFDHDDAEQMALHFPDVPVGHCPSCHGHNAARTIKRVRMHRETRPEHLLEMAGDKRRHRHLLHDETV